MTPLRVRAASLTQAGVDLVLKVRLTRDWRPDRSTAGQEGRLCLHLAERDGSRRVCVGGGPPGVRVVTRAAGGWIATPLPTATVAHPARRQLVVRFGVEAAGLPWAATTWMARMTWTGPPCSPRRPCASAGPVRAALMLTQPAPIGCLPSGASYRDRGAPGAREVALTFDDGPSAATPSILNELESRQAPATFFLVGREIAGRERLLARMRRDGDALGDHSWSHVDLSGAGTPALTQLAETNARIEQATGGYVPCLFRAPYGLTSPALIAQARGLDMLTIQWDVDPRDWSLPGADAIVADVLQSATDGAIVLLHDGGGDRQETVDALPAIIDGLRRRGLRLVTVPQLLGLVPRFVP